MFELKPQSEHYCFEVVDDVHAPADFITYEVLKNTWTRGSSSEGWHVVKDSTNPSQDWRTDDRKSFEKQQQAERRV